jgi:hypothetical protein
LNPGARNGAKFPSLREFLRENAFLSVLRESAGISAGILMEPHGNFSHLLREIREIAEAFMMGSIFRSARFKPSAGCALPSVQRIQPGKQI